MSTEQELWWMSFCDTDKPKGQQFESVIISEAACFLDAVQKTWDLKINPGGEVQAYLLEQHDIDSKHFDKLLSVDYMVANDLYYPALTKQQFAAFVTRLTYHDWYYNYSDDSTMWRRGREERDTLTKEASASPKLERAFTLVKVKHMRSNLIGSLPTDEEIEAELAEIAASLPDEVAP